MSTRCMKVASFRFRGDALRRLVGSLHRVRSFKAWGGGRPLPIIHIRPVSTLALRQEMIGQAEWVLNLASMPTNLVSTDWHQIAQRMRPAQQARRPSTVWRLSFGPSAANQTRPLNELPFGRRRCASYRYSCSIIHAPMSPWTARF